MKAYPGNVAPTREGVYLVTTDSQGCWAYFLGYFNGQYWYEYSKGDCYQNPKSIPRKKTARLAVTAWADISAQAFSEALRLDGKAAVDMEGRQSAITQRDFDRKEGISCR